MGSYKWYLFHQLFWSYIFDLFMGLWKPIPLWPFYFGYSAGISQRIPREYATMQFIIFSFVELGLGFSIRISLVHRYVQAAPLSNYYHRYTYRPRERVFVYVLIYTFIASLFLFGTPIASATDFKALAESLESQNPIMKYFFDRETSLFGFDMKMSNYFAVVGMVIEIVVFLVLIIFIAALYFNYIRILRKNKQQLSAATYNLQKLLFKTLYIQLLLLLTLLVIPLTIVMTLTMYGVRWISTFSLIFFMITSTHAIIDFAVLIYFIKPYRVFLFESFQKIAKKFGFTIKQQSNAIQPLAAISTTIVGSQNR